MNRKISLAVTVEVEGSEDHRSCHRLFENSGRYWIAVAHNDAGKTHIDGDELNVSFHKDISLDRRIDFDFTWPINLYRIQCTKTNCNVDP